jgi:hypothetical protein
LTEWVNWFGAGEIVQWGGTNDESANTIAFGRNMPSIARQSALPAARPY